MTKKIPSQFLESGFVRGVPATNRRGDEVDPLSPKAAKWSLAGAVKAAFPSDPESRSVFMLELRKHMKDGRYGPVMRSSMARVDLGSILITVRRAEKELRLSADPGGLG